MRHSNGSTLLACSLAPVAPLEDTKQRREWFKSGKAGFKGASSLLGQSTDQGEDFGLPFFSDVNWLRCSISFLSSII
jgi:hypothetical protein